MNLFYSFFLWIVTATLVSGCFYNVPEPVQESPPSFPENWTNNHLAEPVSGIWLPVESRALLLQLIDEGIKKNSRLKAQAARVDMAVQNAVMAGADDFPQISAFFRGGRQRIQSTRDSFSAGLDLGWEIDVLGKLDDREKAALSEAAMSVENWRESRLSLVAEIAGQWFTLLENYQQLALIQKREQNVGKNLQIIEEGYKMGLSPSLDLHLARADFSATRARVSARQQEMRTQIRKMEYLLGRYPETELVAAGALPREMPEIPAGIPADILTRRPPLFQSAGVPFYHHETTAISYANAKSLAHH